MKKLFFVILILMLCVMAMYGCENKNYTTISAAEGKQMLDDGDVILVDVREPSEYAEGHISGAILLPVGQIESKAEGVLTNKKAKIIVYCRSGRRSADAAKQLVDMGYSNIYDMGGIQSWINAGYPTVV